VRRNTLALSRCLLLHLPKYSVAAFSRPSLLMQFLRAIGPGTVIVKAGPAGARNDGAGCELLRYNLWQWAFHPLPDAHFPFRESQETQLWHEALETLIAYEVFGGTAKNDRYLNAYQEWKSNGVTMIQRWSEIRSNFKKDHLGDWLKDKVVLPEAGPILIVGSPEGYLSYDWPVSTNGNKTALHELLADVGYSDNYRLVPACYGGGLEFVSKRTPIEKNPGVERDIGLVFLGRSPGGRTVVVLAGSSSPFGTFSAIRAATDYGRNEINSMVLDFIGGRGKSCCAAAFVAERKLPKSKYRQFRLSDPISLRFLEGFNERSGKSDLEFRRAEVSISKLNSTPSIPLNEQTLLARYLSSKGPVGVIAKWYPYDLRDDAAAMDILEFALDDSINYPIPPNLPRLRKSLRRNVSDVLDVFVPDGSTDIDQSKKISLAKGKIKTASALMLLDQEARELFCIWKEASKVKKASDKHFAEWYESQYRTPLDGPVIVLGTPSSFLGSDPPETDGYKTSLFKILEAANYPNRYMLLQSDDSTATRSEIIDRKYFVSLNEGSDRTSQSTNFQYDAGIITLSKGPNGRDVLIIAGINWLGTLAGVRLLFTHQRPSVDKVIQDYINNDRSRVDLYYTCRLMNAAQDVDRAELGEASYIWLQNEGSDEIDIDTHGTEFEPEFTHNRKAEEIFQDLFDKIHAQQIGEISLPRDENKFFTYSLELEKNENVLTIVSRKPVKSSKEWLLCGNEINSIYDGLRRSLKQDLDFLSPHYNTKKIIIDEDSGRRKKDVSASIIDANLGYCGKYLVLGESGVGKENVPHFLLTEIERQNKRKANFVALNTANLNVNLLTSEIYGTVKGAFTGAYNRVSRFEKAIGGIFFFDEFASLDGQASLEVQSGLLRALETYTFQRVGLERDINLNCLFVAATNRATNNHELQKVIESGLIRHDIRNRFEGRVFFFPTLRDRPLEILPAFIQKLYGVYDSRSRNRPRVSMCSLALKLLLYHHLPGNFRDIIAIVNAVVRKLDPTLVKDELKIKISDMQEVLASDSDCRFMNTYPGFNDPSVFVRIQLKWGKGNELPVFERQNRALVEREMPVRQAITSPYFIINNKIVSRPENDFVDRYEDLFRKSNLQGEGDDKLIDKSPDRFVLMRDLSKELSLLNVYEKLLNEDEVPDGNVEGQKVDKIELRMKSVLRASFQWLDDYLNDVRGQKRQEKLRMKPTYYRMVKPLSTASDLAYKKLREDIERRCPSADSKFKKASLLIKIYLGDEDSRGNYRQRIDWEILTILIYVITGIDVRKQDEKEWMDKLATFHGHVLGGQIAMN
jgi:hypothetical protein